MVASVRSTNGKFVAIHRTFLSPDGRGKAPVNPAKMSLGPITGAGVWFAKPAGHMIVGEGIESTLSAMQASRLPGVAGLSANGLRCLVLPAFPLCEVVTIAADSDAVGRAAAEGAAEHWHAEGRKVRIALPPPGKDWNDVIREGSANV